MFPCQIGNHVPRVSGRKFQEYLEPPATSSCLVAGLDLPGFEFQKKKFNVEVYTPWNWQSAPGNALYYMDYSLNKKSLLEKQYELLGIQLAT